MEGCFQPQPLPYDETGNNFKTQKADISLLNKGSLRQGSQNMSHLVRSKEASFKKKSSIGIKQREKKSSSYPEFIQERNMKFSSRKIQGMGQGLQKKTSDINMRVQAQEILPSLKRRY